MNKSILSGYIANNPKYTVRHEYRETMLRAILIEDGAELTVMPLIFYNWCAERARKALKQDMRVLVEGRIAGHAYTDETGALRYQTYLVVSDFSSTLSEIDACQEEHSQESIREDKRFPLDVTDFEDIIRYMPKIG